MVQIAPSLLAADFTRLKTDIQKVTRAGADLLHLDIMDGHFVPNISFGPAIVAQIRPLTSLPFDVHLMLDHPQAFVKPFVDAGADIITFHIECQDDIADTIAVIRKYGRRVGLSLRPGTSISRLIPFLPMIDLVLVMSVEPGFGGQAFQKEALSRIAELKDLIGTKPVQIAVDGGINTITAPACRLAGADILVAGSAIFKHKDYRVAIKGLRHD